MSERGNLITRMTKNKLERREEERKLERFGWRDGGENMGTRTQGVEENLFQLSGG